MKSLFSGYYSLTEEEFKKLWGECTFVFDTNTLLNLYRYDKKTRDLLLEVMELIEDRIWIPYQIALEYHKNMLREIITQNDTYQEITKEVRNGVEQLKNKVNSFQRHSNINVDAILTMIDDMQRNIEKELKEKEESKPDLNVITQKISSLLENKIGEEYTQDKLDEICKDGLRRYENEIPPGYKDNKDKDKKKTINNGLIYENKFGDLIFWHQILDVSKKEEIKSVILVTDDVKEDWVTEIKGKKQGPRPELIEEFKNESGGKSFYLYNTVQFLKFAKRFLKLPNETLDNVKIDQAIENVESTIARSHASSKMKWAKFDKDKRVIYEEIKKNGLTSNYIATLQSSQFIDKIYVINNFIDDIRQLEGVIVKVKNVDKTIYQDNRKVFKVEFSAPVLFSKSIVEDLKELNILEEYEVLDIIGTFQEDLLF